MPPEYNKSNHKWETSEAQLAHGHFVDSTDCGSISLLSFLAHPDLQSRARHGNFVRVEQVEAAAMAGRLAGKRALVTAAGQGIGRAIGARLCRRGRRACSRPTSPTTSSPPLAECADRDAPARRHRRGGDRGARRRTRRRSTSCSTAPALCITARSSTPTRANGTSSFDLNVRSMFLMIRAFLPKMLERGRRRLDHQHGLDARPRSKACRTAASTARPRRR